MAKKSVAPALEPHEALQVEISELRIEVANLRAFVQIANEIFEGIREDLQWLTQNGIEIREPVGRLYPIPVLKSMALDPAGDDWGEKLVINHGLTSEPSEPLTKPPANTVAASEQAPVSAPDPTPPKPELPQPSSPPASPLPRPRDRLF